MADARAHKIVEPLFDKLRTDAMEIAESLADLQADLKALLPDEPNEAVTDHG